MRRNQMSARVQAVFACSLGICGGIHLVTLSFLHHFTVNAFLLELAVVFSPKEILCFCEHRVC